MRLLSSCYVICCFALLFCLGLPVRLLAQSPDPLMVTSVSVEGDTPYSGWPLTLVVNFNRASPGAQNFTVYTDGPAAIPSQVQLPASQSSARIPGTFGTRATEATATVTVVFTDPVTQFQSSSTTTIGVHPILVSSVTFSAAAVRTGSSLTATVHVSHALYDGGSVHINGESTQYPSLYASIPAMSSSVDIPITATGNGVCSLSADYSGNFLRGYAIGYYTATPDAKSPAPGNSSGGSSGGGPPQKCLICSGCVTASINMYSANVRISQSDPVATRGYPLVCNIHINSQTVETARAMGNATFTYDIHLATQSVYGNACNGVSHWMVVDGDGTRLDFGPASSSPAATAGIFSHLVAIAGGYQLQGAGPPEDLASAGNFTYTFNSVGQLTQINDPAGNAQMLNYDVNNHLTGVLDVSSQKQITFQYTGNLITQVVANGGGAATTLAYQNGRLASSVVSNLFGTATTVAYNYNADGSPSSVVRDGDMASAESFTYTAYTSRDCGTPILMANAMDSTRATNIAYGKTTSTNNAVASVWDTNSKGGVTKYDFDAQGNVLRTTLPILAGATYATTIDATYDANHNILSVTDGSPLSFTYAANGLLATASNGYGNTTTITHNGADVTSAKDPVQAAQSKMETVAYGDANQPHVPTAYTDANGNIWGFAHNLYGQITQVTPPAGSPLASSSVTYNENANSPTLGYPLSATDGNGDVTTFDSYDLLGDLLQVSTYPVHGNAAVKNTTTFTYDAAQRMTSVTYPDGKGAQTAYVGRHLDHSIDAANTRFDYFYCPVCDALTGISGPLGWTLGWTYDGDHQLSDFWDANGHNTHYTYGSAGELTQVTYPDNSGSSLLYNYMGQVRQVTNTRGQQTQLAYDYVQRLQTISYPTSGRPSTTFSYNTDSTVHSVVDGVGTSTITYAPNGWVLSVVYDYTASGLTNAQELDYTYYPDGLCHTLTWKSGSTTVASWTYSYDAGGRLSSVSNNWNEATGWTYDGEGKLTGQSNANGTGLSLAYNQARGWPTSLQWNNSAGVFASYGLSYDGGNNTVGNLTGVTEQNGSTESYGYDALYRLTSDARTGTNAGSHSYGYDLAGNATTVNGSTFASYDNANKISSLSGGTISYDADGNLTSVSGTNVPASTFTWDERDRMLSATANSTTVNYGYGAGGLRMWSQVGSGTKTFYMYSGTTLLGEIPVGSSAPSAVYTWGATGLISERLTATNKSLWYAFGPQGETRQVTDSTSAVVDTYAYSPYGVQVASTGNDTNPFRYGGQAGYYTDANNLTGAILCGLRWYMPQLGRWLSRDPIGYAGSVNLYEYCSSNPIGGVDVLGLQQSHGVRLGTNTLVVFGDQAGIPDVVARLGNWLYRPKCVPGTLDDITYLDKPSVDEFIKAAADADEIFVWSHGSPDGDLEIGPGIWFSMSTDFPKLIAARKGKKKFGRVQLRACGSVGKADNINKWLSLSNEVDGFAGWSLNQNTGQLGVYKNYTSPVTNDPQFAYYNGAFGIGGYSNKGSTPKPKPIKNSPDPSLVKRK